MKSSSDYHYLYLKPDVLLLTDVFEKFINWSLKYYGLDRYHYFSSPGLSWDAMLKMTAIELGLISDINMHLYLGIYYTGIYYITKRYSKANNKYMTDYNNSEESIFITYLDANNLYGWAMSKYVPYGGFEWLSPEEIKNLKVNSMFIMIIH